MLTRAARFSRYSPLVCEHSLEKCSKNIGLTEVQIHDVIPDHEPKSKESEEEKKTNGQAAPAAPSGTPTP